jgi:hypothetical protein
MVFFIQTDHEEQGLADQMIGPDGKILDQLPTNQSVRFHRISDRITK